MKKNKIETKKENLIMDKLYIIGSFILLGLPILSHLFCGNFEYINTLPLCFILLLSSYIIFLNKKEKNHSNIIYSGSFIILLGSILLCVFSTNIYLSLGNIILLATALFLSVSSSYVFKNQKNIIIFSLGLVTITSLVSMYMFRNSAIGAGGGNLFWSKLMLGQIDRLFGTYLNPNFYAGFLSMVLPISLGSIFIFKDKKYAILFTVFSIFIIITLCLTGSKFAFISLFFGLITMIIVLIKTKSINKDTIKTLVIISLISLIFFGLFSRTLISRIESAGSSQVHSTEFRIVTWKTTLNIIKANPIIGVFPGRFNEVYPQYTIAATTKHAHSSYLQFASEYGLIIFIITLCLLVFIFKYALKFNKEEFHSYDFIDNSKIGFLYAGLLGGFISEVIHNLVDSDLYIGSHILVFALICGIFLSFNKEENTSKFLINKYQNLTIIYIIACIWITSSVLMFAKKDYISAYQFFPNNYLALRELGRESTKYQEEYFKKAAEKAPYDYISYQILGDCIFYNRPVSEFALNNYEKALKLHPHSTLIMTKIISWASINKREDLVDKYNNKLIYQENSLYEKLKGVPELVDTNYAKAHIYFGNKYLYTDKTKSIYHYKKAIERYNKWIVPENINFLIANLFNDPNSVETYDKNIELATLAYRELEKLENKSYESEIQLINNKLDYVKKETKKLTDAE